MPLSTRDSHTMLHYCTNAAAAKWGDLDHCPAGRKRGDVWDVAS